MNDFDKLLKISNEEISENTHILIELIEHIKNKDYDKIKIKAHFNGFIQSISNEYNLDLQFLIDEYDDFYHPKLHPIDKNITDNQKNVLENTNIFPEDRELEDNKETNNHYITIITGIFILVIAMFFIIFNDNTQVKKKVSFVHERPYKKPIIKKPIKKIIKLEKALIKEDKKKEEESAIFDLSKTKKMYQVKNDMLLIEPFRNNNIWIGTIDLNNKKQVGNILRGQTSYKLKSNTIILTGHGYCNFINKNNNKLIKYRTLKKLFFYYKDGFLYQLKKQDVLALNGGFTW